MLPPRRAARPSRSALIAAVAATFALTVLAGCSASSDGSSSSLAESAPAVRGDRADSGAADSGAADSGAADSGVGDSAAAGSTDVTAASGTVIEEDRQIVTTGTAAITVDDPASAASDLVEIVEGAGGRIDARSEVAPSEQFGGSANLTVRIPADALTAAVASMRDLGDLRELTLSDDDVTSVARDLDARITALRTSVDRLVALVDSAASTKDLIALENAISDRQGQLESMEAERRSIADNVSFATVDVTLTAVTKAPAAAPTSFWTGLASGWGAFTGFLASALVALGVAVPWLGFLGVLGGAAWVVARTLRRRRASS
jgi:hypothetical protein